MKQTKKMTRQQRIQLTKAGIDIEGVRILTENHEYIIYVTPDGQQHTYDKPVVGRR